MVADYLSELYPAHEFHAPQSPRQRFCMQAHPGNEPKVAIGRDGALFTAPHPTKARPPQADADSRPTLRDPRQTPSWRLGTTSLLVGVVPWTQGGPSSPWSPFAVGVGHTRRELHPENRKVRVCPVLPNECSAPTMPACGCSDLGPTPTAKGWRGRPPGRSEPEAEGAWAGCVVGPLPACDSDGPSWPQCWRISPSRSVCPLGFCYDRAASALHAPHVAHIKVLLASNKSHPHHTDPVAGMRTDWRLRMIDHQALRSGPLT